MNVKFYTFSKRENSTKQPAANSEALNITDVELKYECSFLNPRSEEHTSELQSR